MILLIRVTPQRRIYVYIRAGSGPDPTRPETRRGFGLTRGDPRFLGRISGLDWPEGAALWPEKMDNVFPYIDKNALKSDFWS